MMATPISKLPPPAMTSKNDRAALPEGPPNYLDAMNEAREAPPPAASHYYEPPPQQPQHYQQQPPQQYYHYQPPAPPPEDPQTRRRRRPLLSLDTLKAVRVWIVAAIVFLAITAGLPRLQQFAFATNPLTGQASMLGVALLASASGLVFAAADHFAPPQ